MPRDPITDMHSDAWWMRAFEGELSRAEEEEWQAHLVQCQSCRREWEAMTQVDMVLRTASPPPLLPEGFTARTVTTITRKQKLRHMLRFVAGFLIFVLVAWIGFSYFDSTLASLIRAVTAVISGRQILFAAFVRTLVGLVVTAKALVPLMFGVAGAILLLMTPNSVLATVMVVWFSRRKRAGGASAI